MSGLGKVSIPLDSVENGGSARDREVYTHRSRETRSDKSREVLELVLSEEGGKSAIPNNRIILNDVCRAIFTQ